MKQLIQSFKTGETILEEVPVPCVSRGNILIKTKRSLVSSGTERMLVEFGKASLLQKARQQPERLKQVWEKVKTNGLAATLEAVYHKLEQPIPLGYCNAGIVIAVGEGVSGFKTGNRVASNGPHAEYVLVPQNLAAHIPANVSEEEAAFTVVGAIGLQGIRLCNPTLGETIVVIGLGLIGLLTAELLICNGCRVIGTDPDPGKITIAEKKGIICISPVDDKDSVRWVQNLTGEIGADAVIITASAKTDELISQAARMSRKRGRIILVGVTGLHINRVDFYEKELSFQVSCSYGPGRYDEAYEQKGIDYPLSYVRWTAKRNFEAVLDAISKGRLDVRSLITERIPLESYHNIYDTISNNNSIASIIEYPGDSGEGNVVSINPKVQFNKGRGGIGIIGAGNFTQMKMLPALKKAKAPLVSIASSKGVTGTALAKKYGIAKSTTDYATLLTDPLVELVIITTRHHQHARMVEEGLKAGKHVFTEKPLALQEKELNGIIRAYDGTKTLTVGFNRRFSPHIQKIKALTGDAPMNVIATMNAGSIPANTWVQDIETGGGRIIGEACHHIDLVSFLTGSRIRAVCMNAMGVNPAENTDNASILLRYKNGSTGVINYFSNGSRRYPKERVEIYSMERTVIMDDFRVTTGYGFRGFSRLKTKQDKGHDAQFSLLTERIREGGKPLIPFDEIINTTKACFAAIESLKKACWVEI